MMLKLVVRRRIDACLSAVHCREKSLCGFILSSAYAAGYHYTVITRISRAQFYR